MSISNEQTQKSSKSNFQEDHLAEEEDDTPRRVPVVRPAPLPAWTPPARPGHRQPYSPVPVREPAGAILSRPMPAKQYTQQHALTLSAQATTSLSSSPGQHERAAVPAPPPLIAQPHARRPGRRGRLALPMLGALALLAILIALGSFFAGNTATNVPGQVSPGQTAHTSAFVQPPLNAAQIDSLQHLVKYMKY